MRFFLGKVLQYKSSACQLFIPRDIVEVISVLLAHTKRCKCEEEEELLELLNVYFYIS